MPKTPDQFLAWLDDQGIPSHTTHHDAVATVAESQALRGTIAGLHAKNLFLKDKKSGLWLVVAEEERPIDLKALRKHIGAGNLSFAKPDVLMAHLGVTPGSVTPFAVINDTQNAVQVVLDQALSSAETVNFHPLTNTATTTLRGADLLRVLNLLAHTPLIVDLDVMVADPT